MRCLVALASLAIGCTEGSASSSPPAPLRVEVVRVSVSETDAVYVAAGTIRALRSAVLSSKVVGRVRRIEVVAGQEVRAGQLLVSIDDRELRARYRQALASVGQAKRGLDQTRSELAAAAARAEVAAATHARYQALLAEDAVSEQVFDQVRADYLSASAAKATALAAEARARAQVTQARAEAAASHAQLGDARIAAPFDGWVVERHVDPGVLASPDVPLLVIEQRRPLRVEVPVDESLAGRVALGSVVEVLTERQTHPWRGVVVEVVPAVAVPARTFVVKIDLPGEPGLGHLRSGMFARVRLRDGRQRRLLAPRSAVLRRGQLSTCFVVEHGRALLRLLTLGDELGGEVEVLSGLRRGEAIVVDPGPALKDGTAVMAVMKR